MPTSELRLEALIKFHENRGKRDDGYTALMSAQAAEALKELQVLRETVRPIPLEGTVS
jgi:hypothetical protein